MAGERVTCVIWSDELTEAAAVFARWRGRLHELPRILRDEIEALAAENDFCEVVDLPDGVDLQLNARARVLLGNLRARS
jgi:hypothetical protein